MVRILLNSIVLVAVVYVSFDFPHSGFALEPLKGKATPQANVVNDYDEAILKHFKQPTDTAALLAYLKARSASDDDLLAIPALIKQLGSEKFNERRDASNKLIALGLPAFMPLRDAQDDPEPERARMVKVTIEKLDRGTHTVAIPPIAIRLLMTRRPPVLLEALLRYLPFTTDPEVEEDIYYAIDEMALSDVGIHPALVKALDDRLPARRALAACIVARLGSAEQKNAARKLLNDVDADVRLRAAQGFLAGQHKAGIPTLIDLLDGKPVSLAWQAEELLTWMAGSDAPQELVWAGGERAVKAKAAWKKWWNSADSKINLAEAAKKSASPRLISSKLGAMLMGSNGRVRWEPWDLQAGLGLNNVTHMRNRDRLLGVVDITERADQLIPISKHCICEATLEHKIVRQTVWRCSNIDKKFCEVAPNSIATIFADRHVMSFGVEGKLIADLDMSKVIFCDATHGLVPRCSFNGLVLLTVFDNVRHFECCLLDPLTAEIVYRAPLPGDKPDGWSFATTGGCILLRGFKEIWVLGNERQFQSVHKSEGSGRPNHHAIAALGRGKVLTYDDPSKSIGVYSYTPDWRVLSTTRSPWYFGSGEVIQLPMRLVSFGFP